jgi:tRNA-dihydrouridine synthase 1
LGVIREIVNAVGVPVIANGGIDSAEMVGEVLERTGAAGVMIGQALLTNPHLFGERASPFEMAREYLSLVVENDGPFESARRHMFYFLEGLLGNDGALRARLGTTRSVDELQKFILGLERQEVLSEERLGLSGLP